MTEGDDVRAVITSVVDIVGVLLLAAFAWFVWPPAALVVLGVACLVGSWQHATPPPAPVDDEVSL